MTIPSSLTHLHDALPADSRNDGPIAVEASDLRAVLELDRFPERHIIDEGTTTG